MSDTRDTVYRQLTEGQSKYTYFMLTAAGGAVAFAISQTQGAVLKWPQLPLGLAVLCWGLSFFCGARNLQYVNSTIYANLNLLHVQFGHDPEVGQHPVMIEAASEGIRAAMEGNSKGAGRYARRQFWFLVYGAVLFVVWHVLEMWLRTVSH